MIRRRSLLIASIAAPLAAPTIVRAQTSLASLRGKTIVVNWPAHPHYDVATTLVPEFTQATGIKVEIDKMQYLRMHDKQVLEMTKSQGDYDCIAYVVIWKSEYNARGFLAPMEPFLAQSGLADPTYDIRDLVTGYLENIGLVGGPRGYLPGPGAKLVGIPFGAETDILAYRKDILAKYDLPVPETYDQLLNACRVIKAREAGMGGLTSRGQAGHQADVAFLEHFTPFGGVFFDDKWEPRFAEAPGLAALTTLKEIVDTGPPGIAGFGFGEMQNAFLQGQAAMYLDSISIFGPAANPVASRIVGKVGYAIHPKAAVHSGETGGFGMGIPRNSANKEAAFAFIQWMTAKAQDKRIALAGGVASRWSTVADADVRAKYPEYAVLEGALKIANPDWRPLIPEWGEINEGVMGIAVSDAITGVATPKAALEGAVPKVRAIMQRAGYYKKA